MLQQTTVAAVIPYFERFLSRFPQVSDLAAAPENDVLRLWEGLGYYSRARNIHKAANVIVTQHQGVFPTDVETLQSLPGIGRYTAGAIVSFAYNAAAPIVEANTLRLYCRLQGYDGDPRSKEGQQILWSFAEAILPRTNPGRLNQAMIELGATKCLPREPQCDSCPVNAHCSAFREGTQSTIPQQKSRIAITEVTEVSIAIQKGAEFLLRKRTAKERWAGLWDFVRFEVDRDSPAIDPIQISESVLERTGLKIEIVEQVTELKHSVTRYRITLKCYLARRMNGHLKSTEEWKWVKPGNFANYPLSVTARQFAERIQIIC